MTVCSWEVTLIGRVTATLFLLEVILEIGSPIEIICKHTRLRECELLLWISLRYQLFLHQLLKHLRVMTPISTLGTRSSYSLPATLSHRWISCLYKILGCWKLLDSWAMRTYGRPATLLIPILMSHGHRLLLSEGARRLAISRQIVTGRLAAFLSC